MCAPSARLCAPVHSHGRASQESAEAACFLPHGGQDRQERDFCRRISALIYAQGWNRWAQIGPLTSLYCSRAAQWLVNDVRSESEVQYDADI